MTTNYPCNARVERLPRCRPSGPTCCNFPSANRVAVQSYRTGGHQKCSKSAHKAGTDTWGNYFGTTSARTRNNGARSPTKPHPLILRRTACLVRRKIKACGHRPPRTILKTRPLLSQKALTTGERMAHASLVRDVFRRKRRFAV